jgi:BirA family biotin operon repressor/biotin-[acetyl-CoA-carboxylase] ligase
MALREAHRERSATVGRNVRVERDGDDLAGRAVDVAVDGALVVEVADGSTVEVLAGDVVHLRTD